MDPAYYNTVQDLELRNSLEGDLLLIGYDEKLAFSILSAMVNGKVVKRDIKVVDDFAKVPWQKAFDFSNEVKNKIKKHGEYVKQRYNAIKPKEKTTKQWMDMFNNQKPKVEKAA